MCVCSVVCGKQSTLLCSSRHLTNEVVYFVIHQCERCDRTGGDVILRLLIAAGGDMFKIASVTGKLPEQMGPTPKWRELQGWMKIHHREHVPWTFDNYTKPFNPAACPKCPKDSMILPDAPPVQFVFDAEEAPPPPDNSFKLRLPTDPMCVPH